MKLSKNGFDLLALLERKGPGRYSQKSLSEELGFSVGSVNKLIKDYADEGLLISGEKLEISDAGLAALEPYRVKRAIIVAAGFSERLAPVVLSTPKPLVSIKGKRIVDTLIDALLLADIRDITMVIGYKAEEFKVLKEKYPMIRFAENPLFNQSGNITTLFAARDKIDSCYICDADLYIHNPEVIHKYEYASCFLGVPVRETDDWCYTLDGKEISEFGIGGEKCMRTIFITYLTKEDSARCKEDLAEMIESRGGKEHHWFDVLFGKNKKKYAIQSRTCYPDDVTEIDTVGDLIKLDESYLNYQFK